MAPNIDNIIAKLLGASSGPQVVLDFDDIKYLCKQSVKLFKQEPILLRIDMPVKICGDLHGQYQDLLIIFQAIMHPPHSNYLFLGGYVDGGTRSVEVLSLLLAYKIKYPQNFFMLRGSQEDKSLNQTHGFLQECMERFGEVGKEVYDMFTSVYGWMPVSAVVQRRILCMHGGISPKLDSLVQIRELEIGRPYKNVPKKGLLHDLLWANPNRNNSSLHFEEDADGNHSYLFDEDSVKYLLKALRVGLIVRSHEVVAEGHEFWAGRSVLTIFSARRYGAHDNKAAILSVDENLHCTLNIFL